MISPLSEYPLGGLTARYLQDTETGAVELQLLPAGCTPPPDARRRHADSLVQAYLTGDELPGGYSGGRTLRNSGTVRALRLEEQHREQDAAGCCIVTTFAHPKGQFVHRLRWQTGAGFVTSETAFTNRSDAPVALELLSSFCLGGLSPLAADAAPGTLWLHRLLSGWSMEGRLQSDPVEALGLEPSWARFGVRCLRFGQAGSMPCNGWFPWLMAEDRRAGVFWGCTLKHNASWQMEACRQDDGLSLCGGLADSESGQWCKTLAPGETFVSPTALLTAVQTHSLDEAAAPMVEWDQNHPPAELPLVFNEYCSSWGSPSQESVERLVKAVRGHGFRYFVIDCGWYKAEGVPWDTSMGDYDVSPLLFPAGLQAATSLIRGAGMVPGLWFEPETVGHDARAFGCTDHQLHRRGTVLTTPTRRFWDLRDPWVRQRLNERVIGLLKDCGFGYVKLDYNDTIGPGCDGAESPGEALRLQMEASRDFVAELQREIPGLVIENCASGGHRLDPGTVAATALSSFSDAHECAAIPIIAANLHRAVPPAKSLVWAVLRKTDDARRLAWSLTAGLLGRLCVSGDAAELSTTQWKIVDEGLAFYRLAAPVIRRGVSRRYGPTVTSYDTPEGWQGIVRTGDDGCLVVLHRFGGADPGPITVPLPWPCHAPAAVYEVCGAPLTVHGTTLTWQPAAPMSSAALYFTKEGT